MYGIQVQMINLRVSVHWWRELTQHFIRPGDTLEIRCWKEEEAECRRAAQYGTPREEGHEMSFQGTVTAEFLQEILSQEPADKSIYNKMTEYFTINTASGNRRFCSAHYGTELYIQGATPEDAAFFRSVMASYGDDFSFDVYPEKN